VTERSRATGHSGSFEEHFRGDPPEVPGAVMAWLASSADADHFVGRIVHAQAACAKHGLVPGWSPPG
jgi:hypothetical protein